MKNNKIDTALILAAGFGKRMLPLTSSTPKPLIKVKGKPLIDYCINNLKKIKINKIIINVHYESEQIINYINKLDQKILISDETKKLLNMEVRKKKASKLQKLKTLKLLILIFYGIINPPMLINSLMINFIPKKMTF